ncbi:MAG: right-handed parallel beta-helix repeat-containing protein [Acidimicrobiia bacterium]|nr:right-handed parallel beta-helix repeat-containing protein [Acidimicrobiia bacterium]
MNHHMFSLSVFPTATPSLRRLRWLVAALVMGVAVVVITVLGGSRADAAETCTGSDCDTVAFEDGLGFFTLYQDLKPHSLVGRFYYGNPGDRPLMGDWDCDGEQTPGMYRRSTGLVYLRNSNTQGVAHEQYIFGNPSDIPIVGDFNGNGCDTVSVYRPSEAKFYLSYTLDARVADIDYHFGAFGDVPVVGDWDGDGVDTVGIFRPSTGLVALSDSHTSGVVSKTYKFGGPGDTPLAGDWDGDGDDTVGLYRYASGTLYLSNRHSTGSADYSLVVGRYKHAVAASGVRSVPSGVVSVPGITPPPPRPASGQIRVSGDHDVVIENVHVTNPNGDCVVVSGSANVTIRNATIGPCGGNGVYITDSDHVTVTDSYITDAERGVLVHRSDSIKVDENVFVHTGRNFVQFDKVDGPGSSISYNRGKNELGGSSAEDLISLYQSNGTSGSPIRIVGNRLRDGGPSGSGSGIMLGDGGGSHQTAENNVLVDPGQVGIGVAGGYGMKVIDNQIYSSSHAWSNVGIYTWDLSGGCSDVEVRGNDVDFRSSSNRSNGYWNGGGCGADVYGNDWDADLGTWIW